MIATIPLPLFSSQFGEIEFWWAQREKSKPQQFSLPTPLPTTFSPIFPSLFFPILPKIIPTKHTIMVLLFLISNALFVSILTFLLKCYICLLDLRWRMRKLYIYIYIYICLAWPLASHWGFLVKDMAYVSCMMLQVIMKASNYEAKVDYVLKDRTRNWRSARFDALVTI